MSWEIADGFKPRICSVLSMNGKQFRVLLPTELPSKVFLNLQHNRSVHSCNQMLVLWDICGSSHLHLSYPPPLSDSFSLTHV